METLILEVERRHGRGKGFARRDRSRGKLPGVVYGAGKEAQGLVIDALDFERRIAHLEGTHLVELRSGDSALDRRTVLLREIQLDPISGSAMHADFCEVDLSRPIEVKVALHFEGKAAGVTLGGILQPILREILVRCLPTAIPDSIVIDVSELVIHSSIHLYDIVLPEGVELAMDANEPIVSVLPPVVEKKAEEAAAGAETPAAEGATPAAGAEGGKSAG